MFSSLEEGERKTVIEKCYWPLLRLAKKGYKAGIELTGITLEIINSIDPSWIKEFKSLLDTNMVELIGSGYAQIIGPLVPAEVNDWNQKLGIEIYRRILGLTPKIALINEMAYSSGIIEHYINNGYEAIIMEWNNPRKYHSEWDNQYRYYAQRATNQQGKSINLLWADSIAFQKFQRYAHGETTLKIYLEYLKTHQSSEERFFPLYTSDAEVFDYRPGRFKTEVVLSHTTSEWNRIEVLMEKLSQNDNIRILLPSAVLEKTKAIYEGNKLSLESPEQPIPVKKQQKYNITRWALTGRNDLWLNTTCYRLYTKVLKLNKEVYWKKLCYFWSSDFRTHITSLRWNKLAEEINAFENKINHIIDDSDCIDTAQKKETVFESLQNKKYFTFQNSVMELIFNLEKGCVIQSLKTQNNNGVLIGTLDHGYFEDIEYGMDFFSGHAIIEQLGKHKLTDLSRCKPQITQSIDSFTIKTSFQSDTLCFDKEIHVDGDLLTLSKQIILPSRKKQVIHPFHFTFIPETWDQHSLFFATHNGGFELEFFQINDKDFHHSDNLSFLISSKHGLGNTKGVVIIGDKHHKITFTVDPTKSFIIPSIYYKKVDGGKFLFRLIYSAQEIDETFKEDKSNFINAQISIHPEINYS